MKHDLDVIASLAVAQAHAEIHVITPAEIGTLPGIIVEQSDQPELRLATLLAEGDLDGIVRGTVDDKRTLNAYIQLTGEKDTYCPTLVRTPGDHHTSKSYEIFVIPVSNSDGWTRDERLAETLATAEFVKDWGISPSIAIYTAIRNDTYSATKNKDDERSRRLRASYDDAEWLVAQLADAGFDAANGTIELNVAVAAGRNLHVCLNGIVGNQVVRAIMLCGGELLTCTRIGFSRVYEDNSRTEVKFESHIRWAAALANKRKFGSWPKS